MFSDLYQSPYTYSHSDLLTGLAELEYVEGDYDSASFDKYHTTVERLLEDIASMDASFWVRAEASEAEKKSELAEMVARMNSEVPVAAISSHHTIMVLHLSPTTLVYHSL